MSGCLLSFVLQAGKHMLDVEDYYGIARGVRNIAPFAAVTAIPDGHTHTQPCHSRIELEAWLAGSGDRSIIC